MHNGQRCPWVIVSQDLCLKADETDMIWVHAYGAVRQHNTLRRILGRVLGEGSQKGSEKGTCCGVYSLRRVVRRGSEKGGESGWCLERPLGEAP